MTTDLSHTATTLSGWTLMPGMVGTLHGHRCVVLGPDDRPADERHGEWLVMSCAGEWPLDFVWDQATEMCLSIKTADFVPDLDDAATVGCLLELLGERWSINYINDSHVYIAFSYFVGDAYGPTRGAVCVQAAIALGRWPGGDPLRAIEPRQAAAWLRANGWELMDTRPGHTATWRKAAGAEGDFLIELPLSATFRDYARRMREVLDTLAVATNKPSAWLLEEIRATGRWPGGDP